MAITDKVDAIHDARKVSGKTIPLAPSFALTILEAASLEVEGDIQELWAGLIANCTDPGKAFNIKKVYVKTLQELQPLDATILRALFKNGVQEHHLFLTGTPLNAERLAETISADLMDVQISIQSLASLGCLIDSWNETIASIDAGYAGFRVNNSNSNFRLSHLGAQLLLATSNH